MPNLESRVKIRLFLIRVGCTGVGLGIAYGFLWCCTHYYWVHDPDTARMIMGGVIALAAVTGEFITRRQLRALNFFPKNRHLPWTY